MRMGMGVEREEMHVVVLIVLQASFAFRNG